MTEKQKGELYRRLYIYITQDMTIKSELDNMQRLLDEAKAEFRAITEKAIVEINHANELAVLKTYVREMNECTNRWFGASADSSNSDEKEGT